MSDPSTPTIVDAPDREIRTGALIAGAFFVGLLGWSAVIPLDAGALATGVVAVSGKRQAVQHRDGGVVTAIHVREGDTVSKGQMLVQIAASEAKASERGLAGEVLTLLAQRQRLLAERDQRRAFAAPPEFAALPPEDRPLADEALRAQQLLFRARRESLDIQKAVLGQRVRQHNEQISGVVRQGASNRVQQKLIGDELVGMREIAKNGFASLNRIRALERTAAALDGEHGSFQAEIARSREAIGETHMQSASLDREMIENVAGELRDVQVRLDELQPKLAAVREQLARATVRAPASGRVVGSSVFTVGGVVAAGDTLMEIVPQDRALLIEAKVAPDDASDLAVGQATQVRFTALHERNLPILTGRITNLSADSFTDERTGERFFRADVSVPSSELTKMHGISAGRLRAGLTAEVLVPLRKRTAFGYLIEPLTQTLWRVGREH